jgi:hypothetical protein
MPPAQDFRQTVTEELQDPKYRRAYFCEMINALLRGDLDAAKSALRIFMKSQFLRAAAILMLTVFVAGIWAQTVHAKTHKRSLLPAQNEQLASPVDWGTQGISFFKDSPVLMLFSLETSWIPGEDYRGMFRYKLSAQPTTKELLEYNKSLNTPEKIEAFVRRADTCMMYLEIYDPNEFILRHILLIPQFTTKEGSAYVNGIYANNYAQMSADEYRTFIKGTDTSVSWNISYTCLSKGNL